MPTNAAKKTHLAVFFSCLTLVGLLAASCGTPARHFGDPAAAGAGDVGGGGQSLAGNGAGAVEMMTSAGAGAVSTGGGEPNGGAETGGSGNASGMPACNAQQKLCGGACVDINDPAYGCDPTLCTGAACPSQSTGATVVCQDSACVIGTCPDKYKKCGDKCVAISDPTYGCGATTCDAAACPAAGTGTLICQGSACVLGTCVAGSKKCGDKCVTTDANNGCADVTRCTACATKEACSGTPTTCQCVPTPMATACANKCNAVPNGCGGTYTCAGCTLPQTCGGGGTQNVCGCSKTPMTTACSGKNCGTVSDGCGGNYTCGTCTLPQSCGVTNLCGCNKTPMSTACSGKSCGTASDGCGGTYTCGGCSAPSPVCVSGMCKQCATFGDCPTGSFNCTNNTCVCQIPSPENYIKDGGFDSSSAVSQWASAQASWSPGDKNSCPESGSMVFNGSVSRCFHINTISGTVQYTLAFSYKAADSVSCFGTFYLDAGCQQTGAGADFFNLYADASPGNWGSALARADLQNGTSSVLVQCSSSVPVTMDQIYLRPSSTITGQGF